MQATEDRQESSDNHGAHENAVGRDHKEQRQAGDEDGRLHDGQEKPALTSGLVPLHGGRLQLATSPIGLSFCSRQQNRQKDRSILHALDGMGFTSRKVKEVTRCEVLRLAASGERRPTFQALDEEFALGLVLVDFLPRGKDQLDDFKILAPDQGLGLRTGQGRSQGPKVYDLTRLGMRNGHFGSPLGKVTGLR